MRSRERARSSHNAQQSRYGLEQIALQGVKGKEVSRKLTQTISGSVISEGRKIEFNTFISRYRDQFNRYCDPRNNRIDCCKPIEY